MAPDALTAYPDATPLYERLTAHLGIRQDQLIVTQGSDAAIRRIFETFVDPGDTVLQAEPSYAMFRVYTALYQARAAIVEYAPDRTLSVEQLLTKLAERPRLFLLANPDQPTGTALSPEALRRLAREARKYDVVMVIDEAYYPFHPASALEWRAEFDNLIVTRSFSKSGGIAGLRLGYLVGSVGMIDWIERTRSAFDVNAMAIAAGCWLLDHPDVERDYMAAIEAGRAQLRVAALRLGIECPPCECNFQLLRFPIGTNLRAIVQGLRDEGFLIKGPFDGPALRDSLRVSLAGPDIITAFASAMHRVIERLSQP